MVNLKVQVRDSACIRKVVMQIELDWSSCSPVGVEESKTLRLNQSNPLCLVTTILTLAKI